MPKEGIDCSAKITKPVAQELVKLDKEFVCRYLVPDSMAWKQLTKVEAQIISDAGMDILSVYESTASRALSDKAGGLADGKTSLQCAKAIGQPKGSAIYFAVDFDVTSADQYDKIERYLRGASESLNGEYGVGVYGEYTVVNEMKKRGACKYFWQTYAWSNGKLSAYANVHQYKNHVQLAGITLDLNRAYGNEGFWNYRPKSNVPVAKTKFTDVPIGHYTEEAIKRMHDQGLIVGISDTEFGFNKPVTRQDLALILDRLLGKI